MPEKEPWTVGRLLTWTTDYLKKGGSDTARLDAEILLAEARDCQRIALYTSFNDEVDEATRGRFRELVKRRVAGEPVAYLIGRREFFSLSLNVSPDVLIPRPETEHLVVHALDCIKQFSSRGQPFEVADVGTGSGAIAVAVAKHAPHCHVTAIDISDAALRIAQSNIDQHDLTDQVSLKKGDLCADLPAEIRFDLMLSNPPYVSQSEWKALMLDVKGHEPYAALVGGANGTEVIERLVPQAAARIRPGGWMMIEISPMICDQVCEIIDSSGSFQNTELKKDLAGHVRVVTAQRNAT